jgi:IS1 family transposase
MAESGCAACSFRARYDNNSKSLLGRLWRWHANWCPGWKSYMKSLPDQERMALAEKYDLPRFK